MLKQALILAGGLGTRFRPVRDDIPKPLAEVGGRPVLEHQVRLLAKAGVEHVVLGTGYRHAQVQARLGDGAALGVRLDYSVEPEALGTGGAVAHARSQLAAGPFAVFNGDTLMPELDIQSLAGEAQRQAANMAMVITHPPDAGAYGVVKLSADGARVTGFREKADLGATFARAWISAGLYFFDGGIFDLIGDAPRPCSLENDVFPRALAAGHTIAALTYDGFFGDMGTPAGYRRVQHYYGQGAQ